MESSINSAFFLAVFPIVAVVCLALNVFVRARGGRALKMHIKALGVDILIESTTTRLTTKQPLDAPSNE